MPETARETILRALRNAPKGQAISPSPMPKKSLAANPWEALANELAAVHTGFSLAETPEQAREHIRRIIGQTGAGTILSWEHPLLEELGLPQILQESGAARLSSGTCKERAEASLGITAADALLADSGTIVVRAEQGRERSVSLLPPTHLAIVPRSALLPGLAHLPELLESWKEQGLPSAIHLITGPSCTADIELIKVFGVHGPTAVHVLGLDW